MVKIESKATCKHFYVAQGHFNIKRGDVVIDTHPNENKTSFLF